MSVRALEPDVPVVELEDVPVVDPDDVPVVELEDVPVVGDDVVPVVEADDVPVVVVDAVPAVVDSPVVELDVLDEDDEVPLEPPAEVTAETHDGSVGVWVQSMAGVVLPPHAARAKAMAVMIVYFTSAPSCTGMVDAARVSRPRRHSGVSRNRGQGECYCTARTQNPNAQSFLDDYKQIHMYKTILALCRCC